jgi:putative SOS response-associated peptidase YedK
MQRTWKPRVNNETIRSFAIVTTATSTLCAEVHDRMPVILPPGTWSTPLGEEPSEPDLLKSVLVPYTGQMVMWPVSQRVGNVSDFDSGIRRFLSSRPSQIFQRSRTSRRRRLRFHGNQRASLGPAGKGRGAA